MQVSSYGKLSEVREDICAVGIVENIQPENFFSFYSFLENLEEFL